MPTFVRFWGTRGSIPTPGHKTRRYGGNTSCVEVRIDDVLFICDGGTGLRELGLDIENRYRGPIEAHMLFTHTHWDHIQGFPFFVPAYGSANTLYVYDATPDEHRVHRLLLGQMHHEYFPVSFADLGSRIISSSITTDTVVEGVAIRHFELHHPGGAFAYSLIKNGRKVVYATDHEIDLTLHDPGLVDEAPHALRLAPSGFVRFVQDADLLIADGQYTEEEYPARRGWGHGRALTVVDLALQAHVKQLAIFHHDPMQADGDVDDKIAACRERAARAGSPLVVFGAREGVELKVE